jgi:hypothetical protein
MRKIQSYIIKPAHLRKRKDNIMARIGFKKAKYNKIVGNTYASLTSSAVPVFEKVIDEKFAPEYNSAELYANDGLAESDYSFKKGTLSLTVADDDDKLCAELLGNTTAKEGGEVTSNIEDIAPEFGYGHIIPKLVGGVRKYKVEFFPRVKATKITSETRQRLRIWNLAQPLLNVL